jgi:hypothetical protein
MAQAMCPELPLMLRELVVIYQYHISLLEGFILDVPFLIPSVPADGILQ